MKSKPLFPRLRLGVAILFGSILACSADNPVNLQGWQLNQAGGGVAKLKKDATADAMTITIEKAASPFYLIQLNQPLPGAVNEGDRIHFSFRARSANGNPLRAVLERTGAPYDAVAEIRANISPEWRDYSTETDAVQSYPAGGISARLQCGHQTGVIEFASIRIENLGPDPDAAAKAAMLEPAAVDARIQRIRAGELHIEVRDANGKPVPDANVHIEETRSEFLFGCNIFALDPNNTQKWQIDYQSEFTNLLNYATLPFYWGNFEREQGRPDYEKLESMARWCNEHNVWPKGHPLVWHEAWPRWAPRDADAAIPLLRARVFDLIPRYRGIVNYWDVLNEANNASDFAGSTGEGAWIRRDGPAAVVATALGWAREASGTNKTTLLYNDFNVGAENVLLLKQLRERNALPDAIGLQSHMHDHVWPMRRVWQVCESYVQFKRPIHFTELTVVSSTNHSKSFYAKPGEWPSTPEGEAFQADYLVKFYSLLFSHPSVEAITWWDFSDRHAWRNAPSGLIREDMSPKPAYEKLHALIRGKWWTRADGKTDATGDFTTRAFHGYYRITVTTSDGRRAETTAHFTSATQKPVEVKL